MMGKRGPKAKYDHKRIIEMVKEGSWSYRQIAEVVGCSPSLVCKIAQDAGITKSRYVPNHPRKYGDREVEVSFKTTGIVWDGKVSTWKHICETFGPVAKQTYFVAGVPGRFVSHEGVFDIKKGTLLYVYLETLYGVGSEDLNGSSRIHQQVTVEGLMPGSCTMSIYDPEKGDY